MAKPAAVPAAAPPPKTPKPAEPAAAAAEPLDPPDAAPPDSPPERGPLTAAQLRAFNEAATPCDRVSRLCAALCVAHYEANPRAQVYVDFCFGVLSFALDEVRLSEPKTLALLRVANEVFAYATSPSFSDKDASAEAFPSTEAVYDVFRQLVRAHSAATAVQLPPPPPDTEDASALWDAADVAQIVACMSSSFFRHLAAYQHVFQRPRESLEREVALVVESPLPPPPLATATIVDAPQE